MQVIINNTLFPLSKPYKPTHNYEKKLTFDDETISVRFSMTLYDNNGIVYN